MKTSALSAFTLLELLLVISIIGILSVLVAPAINTVMNGSRATQSGDKILALLNQAKQTALTTNHPVEMRFYQYGDVEVPGESLNDPTSGKFRAVQAFEYRDDGVAIAVGKMERLAPSVIMDSSTTLSSLLNSATASDSSMEQDGHGKDWLSDSNAKPKIPLVGTNYNCCAFRFLPGGSTNLPKTKLSFLTLHNINDGDNRVTPPSNYTTIQIDPENGMSRVYRP